MPIPSSSSLDQTPKENKDSLSSPGSFAASSSTSDDAVVDIFAILTPKPGNVQRILEVCELVGQQSKDYEPGCLKYLVYVQKNAQESCDDKIIYLSQQFTNQAAFDEHLDSEPHTKVINEIAEQDLLINKIVTDEVYVQALGGFDRTMESDRNIAHSVLGMFSRSRIPSAEEGTTTDVILTATETEAVDMISVLHPRPADVHPEDTQESIIRACSHVAAYTSVEEPVCEKYLVFRQCCPSNDQQPSKVILIERYKDQKVFDEHLDADIVKEEMRDCNENLLVKPIDVKEAYVDLVWGFERE